MRCSWHSCKRFEGAWLAARSVLSDDDRCTAAVFGYAIKRMATPSRRSTTAQNSAYDRATTLLSRKRRRAEEYTLFAEGDTLSWIRLPVGYCRRNPKLHCESDVKCLLCDRFAASPQDIPRLQEIHERFIKLGMRVKADVVAAQIRRLEAPNPSLMIPLESTKPRVERVGVPPQAAGGHPAESRLRGGH
jgi:hypothetical protein